MTMHRVMPGINPLEAKNILGIPVASVDWNDAIALLTGLLEAERFTKVSFMNAHNANMVCADKDFAAALHDFLVLPDGVGVDIAARLLYGEPFPANLNGTDFIPGFLAATSEPLTIGLLGTTRRNAEASAKKLSMLVPRHRFVVIHDGFFSAAEEPAILQRLKDLRPHILLVAMGVPRQELWIARNLTGAHCTIPIAVGALLDFLSGAVPRAPEWMRRMRIEWIFRLYIEPGRLWRRYIVGNPMFLARVMRQRLVLRKSAT